MFKRGQTTLLKEAIFTIIGVMSLIFLIVYGLPALSKVLYNTPDKNSFDNFKRFGVEIKNVFNEYSDWQEEGILDTKMASYSMEVPININERLGIKFYNPFDEKPQACKKNDYPCMCLAYVDEFNSGIEPRKCIYFKEGENFLFDVGRESFDGNTDSLGGLIVGSGISSYILTFSNHGILSITTKINSDIDVNGITYVSFPADDPNVDFVDSTYRGESSVHVRGHEIDRLVLHFSVTNCAKTGDCSLSTSEVLRMRGLAIHYSIGTLNSFSTYADAVVVQSTPESARAFHAGCIPSGERCTQWCSINNMDYDAWSKGRMLCNDLTLQNSQLTRDSFEDLNERSIGIEITNLGFSSFSFNPEINKEECDRYGGVLIETTDGLLNYYSGDKLISKPFGSVCWWPYSDLLMNKLIDLCAGILERNPGITLDYEHIIGHDLFAYDKVDPGPLFDWDYFMEQLAIKLDRPKPTRNLPCGIDDDLCVNCVSSNDCTQRFLLTTPYQS